MSEFITKIIFCLLVAAAIGFLMAWFLRRLRILELGDELRYAQRTATTNQLGMAEAERKVATLETTLVNRDTEIAQIKSQTGTSEQLNTTFRSQYESAQLSLGKAAADLTTKDASISSLSSIINMRDKSLVEKETLLRARDESLKLREARINELESQAGTYVRDHEALKQSLANRTQLMTDAQLAAEQAKRDLTQNRQMYQSLEHQLDELKKEINALRSKGL